MELHSEDLPDVVLSRPTKKPRTKSSKRSRNLTQVNIELPEDIKLSLKLEAMQEDTTIGDLILHYLTTNESMPIYEVRKRRSA
jgi:hypothetical protein